MCEMTRFSFRSSAEPSAAQHGRSGSWGVILSCRALHAGIKKRGVAICVGHAWGLPVALGLVLEAVATIGEFKKEVDGHMDEIEDNWAR